MKNVLKRTNSKLFLKMITMQMFKKKFELVTRLNQRFLLKSRTGQHWSKRLNILSMFYQNWLIEVKFIVLGRICEKWPCLYISMCICISDVLYIYTYMHTYIYTIILYVCMPQDFRKWTASIFVFCLLWFLWVLAFWNQKVSLSA